MENNVMSNGRLHQEGPPPTMRFRTSDKSNQAPAEPRPPEEINWLLHRYYISYEFSRCKKIIAELNENWGGYVYYPNYVMGLILRREGKVQDSLDSFQHCYKLDPNSADCVKQIAKSMFLLGDFKKAIDLYLQSKKMTDDLDWELELNLGECYMKVNDLENARIHLTKATELTDNENAFMALVKLYVMEDRIIDAIAVYTRALSAAPECEELLTELGLMYLRLGDTKRAFQQFGTALAQTPTHAKAVLPMAYILQSSGEFDVAFSKYKVAAQSMSESWSLWNNIGMCLYGKQKYVSAITCLKKAHYLNPLSLEASCNLGIVFLATGQPASAAIYLCGAVAAGPKNPLPYMLLGLALKRLNDLDGAEKALSKAHTLDPQDPQVLVNFAVVLDARGKPDRAKELLNVLKDVTVLIDVDPQITGMAKQLAAKLRADEDGADGPRDEQQQQQRTLTEDEV